MDLKFEKGKVTSDFKESDTLENIKSGESIGTIFGKIQKWFSKVKSCITEDGLKDALKDLPQRCYKNDSPKGINIIPNASNTASGSYSITAGISNNSEGNYSVAIGNGNTSQKNYDVSIGFGNIVSDEYSFAIGGHNAITGCDSYALGRNNDVSGDNSYAIGVVNNVTQNFSFVLGHNLISSYAHQVILGSQNIDGDYLFILGNGKNFTRSNALTLDWDGNLWTAGDVTATDSDGNNVSLCETAIAVSNLQNANAPTATKLQTARKINGVAFDGSEDITIPIKGCYAYDESTTASTAPWHKVASCTLTKGSEDAYAVFHVYRTLASTFPGGILKARIRTNPDVTLQSCNLLWEYANNINKEDFILCIIQDQNSKTLTAELWVKIPTRWMGCQFTMIADTDRTSIRNNMWTLYNSSEGQAAYTESDRTITSEFSPIQNTAELSDSGWTRMTISDGNGELYYRKYGKTVELKGSTSPNVDNEWTVCTLPNGYRPSTSSVDVLVIGNSPRKLSISTQGVVTVSNVTAHEVISFHACFLVD